MGQALKKQGSSSKKDIDAGGSSKVLIKQEYLKEIPFGSLNSRVAAAYIWSFYGDN